MSLNATRHNRKRNRPDWVERSRQPKAERPTDRKQRNRNRRQRRKASASYDGGMV